MGACFMNHQLKRVSHHIVSLQGGSDSGVLQTNTVALTPSCLELVIGLVNKAES